MGEVPPLLAFVAGLLFVVAAVLVLRAIFIVVHELGHALAGLAMGLPPREISIGTGAAMARLEVRGVRLTLRRLGGGVVGYVAARPNGAFAFRARHSIILLAGVGAEIVAWLVLFGEPFPPAPQWITSRDGEILYGAITFLALLLVVHDVIANLVPMTIRGVPNDGLRLLAVLDPRSSVEQQHRQHLQVDQLHQAALAQERGELEQVLTRLDAELAASSADALDPAASNQVRPERWQLQRIRAYSLIQLLRYDEAIEASAEAWAGARNAADEDRKLAGEAVACGGLHAYALALAGRQLDLALELAEADVARDRSPSTEHTLGAVLVQRPKPAKGIRLLTATLAAVPTDVDRLETHRLLAIGHWGRGDHSGARDHVRQAIDACPEAPPGWLSTLPEPLRPPVTGDDGSTPAGGGGRLGGEPEPGSGQADQDDR